MRLYDVQFRTIIRIKYGLSQNKFEGQGHYRESEVDE